MRLLAIVLAVTTIGCVPVQTRGHALAGNALLIAASSYAYMTAVNRDCHYHRMDIIDEVVAEAGCETGTQIEQMAAVGVLLTAIVGIGRTLYRPLPATTTSRSR